MDFDLGDGLHLLIDYEKKLGRFYCQHSSTSFTLRASALSKLQTILAEHVPNIPPTWFPTPAPEPYSGR